MRTKTNVMFCQRVLEMKLFQRYRRNAVGHWIFFVALLGTLALLPLSRALAQTADTHVSPQKHEPVSGSFHAPMRFGGVRPDGTVESPNWSGYAVTGSNFTFAKGSWQVPEVACNNSTFTESGFFVGFDGYSNDTVEAIGTNSNCIGGTPQYYAFYELLPSTADVQITDFPVSPGDVIAASVTFSGGKFTLSIHNRTTGQEYSTTQALPGAQRTSAEWIAEALYTGGFEPLADFDIVHFGEDYTGDSGTNYATDSAVNNGPISDFGSKVQQIGMVNGDVIEAIPTALSGDGTSFNVLWISQ